MKRIVVAVVAMLVCVAAFAQQPIDLATFWPVPNNHVEWHYLGKNDQTKIYYATYLDPPFGQVMVVKAGILDIGGDIRDVTLDSYRYICPKDKPPSRVGFIGDQVFDGHTGNMLSQYVDPNNGMLPELIPTRSILSYAALAVCGYNWRAYEKSGEITKAKNSPSNRITASDLNDAKAAIANDMQSPDKIEMMLCIGINPYGKPLPAAMVPTKSQCVSFLKSKGMPDPESAYAPVH